MAVQILLPDESSTRDLGRRIGERCDRSLVLYLKGSLGAGKTTLTRGMLRGLGYDGAVKSPTYTLIEPYQLNGRQCFHLDLYRLADPEELEYIGLRDLLTADALVIVEWPEKGEGYLPRADMEITLEYEGKGRSAQLSALSPHGSVLLKRLREQEEGMNA